MPSYQLLESRLVQVALQGEVAEGFPRWLVGLHLHKIPLHGVVVPDRTPRHQRCACHALQILQEQRQLQPNIVHAVNIFCCSNHTNTTYMFVLSF